LIAWVASSCYGSHNFIWSAVFRACIIVYTMSKHYVSNQFNTQALLQVLLSNRLWFLLGLWGKSCRFQRQCRWSTRTIFCTRVLGLEVITWVNVEKVPVIVLCSRLTNVFKFANWQHKRRHYHKLIKYN